MAPLQTLLWRPFYAAAALLHQADGIVSQNSQNLKGEALLWEDNIEFSLSQNSPQIITVLTLHDLTLREILENYCPLSQSVPRQIIVHSL